MCEGKMAEGSEVSESDSQEELEVGQARKKIFTWDKTTRPQYIFTT